MEEEEKEEEEEVSIEVKKEGEGFQEVSRDNGGNGRNYQESEKIGLKPGETFCLCVSPSSDPVSQFTSTVPIHPIWQYARIWARSVQEKVVK